MSVSCTDKHQCLWLEKSKSPQNANIYSQLHMMLPWSEVKNRRNLNLNHLYLTKFVHTKKEFDSHFALCIYKKKEAPTTDHMGTKVPGRKVWSHCRIWMKNILVTKLNILNFFITKQCYCLCIWKQWLFSVKSQHCLVTDSRIPAGQEVDKQSQVWSAKSMGWMALALCFLA